MSIFDRLMKWVAPEARQNVDRANPRDPVLAEWFGGGGGDAPAVTPRSAMGVPAVYACTNILAESIGALPLALWRTTDPEGKGKAGKAADERVEARDHALHQLLTGRPCPHMTGPEWVEWMVASTALRGDAFSRIQTDARGRITALAPLPYDVVDPRMQDDGTMRYRRYRKAGGAELLQDDEVFRLPWKIQADGTSLSPLALQRESFGLALSARHYQQNLLRNNVAPKGGIKTPNLLSPEAAETLIKSWERRHGGPDNAGRLAIFDGGVEWVNIGMSNEDAQFAELMQMSLRDVARIFRIQPHKIGDLEKATFSNIEHQSIEFVTDTLLPWVRRFEARAESWLLSERDRLTHSVEFNLRGLLRGDAKARGELYRVMFYSGAISANEIRRMEGLNPVEGGDRFYVQTGSSPTDIIDQVLLKDTPVAGDTGNS